MNNPTISIIIPTYNRKELLFKCIDSILTQSYEKFEIIIVDDCSADGTYESISARYSDSRICAYRNKSNMGCFYNRRFGYEHSDGELVIFMDDDDYYIDSDFFKKAVEAYNGNPSLSLIGAGSKIIYEEANLTKMHSMDFCGIVKASDYLNGLQIKYKKPDAFAAVFIREKIDKEIPKMTAINDAPLCMRALLNGDAYLLPDTIGVYRIHGKNISFDLSAEFLMENLNEKKYIAAEAERRGLFENAEKWLFDQTMMTVQYFINGRGRTRQDIDTLCKWCSDNLGSLSKTACKDIKKRYIKRKLRNALKGR